MRFSLQNIEGTTTQSYRRAGIEQFTPIRHKAEVSKTESSR
jgi:hypothetical protein